MSNFETDRHRTDPAHARPAKSRTGLYIGIAAVALVLLLGLMSLGRGGEDTVAPRTIPEPDPVSVPEAVVPANPEPVLE
jgi:hypothetical protein